MKWAVYNLLFALTFPFLLPGFLARMLRRGGYAARMGDRFALYPRAVRAQLKPGAVWVHAVSVGEVQVALQLMREWRQAEPDVRFCFSTTSSTGWRTAEAGLDKRDTLIYNPLDFPNFVKSAFKTIRPRALVLTESEIWPVFIRHAHKSGIPVYLINARVSDRSAPRYAKARWFFKDVFGCFTRIFAQSALDAERLVAAGAPADVVSVTGSFKFDVAHRNEAKERALRDWLGPTSRILLGASTWPGEDEVLLRIIKTLPEDVTLVLAPRHFEKADAVEANILKAGFACVRRSRPSAGAREEDPVQRRVYLADTTGELMGLYGLAHAVFVGKSLCEHGSQNMIEPCLCGKPTVVGPYTENFRPVMSDLLAADAIVQVPDEAALAQTFARWFAPASCDEAKALGVRAAAAVASRRGVVPRCVREMRRLTPAHLADTPRHGTRAKWKSILALATVVAAIYALVCARPERTLELTGGEEFRYKPVRTVSAYLPLLEKAGAQSLYMADEAAAPFAEILARAGLTCFSNDAPDAVDLVLSADPARRDWREMTAKLGDDGVVAWLLDVRKMTMGEFKAGLDAFPCEDAHLWMPGEGDWVLTGSFKPRKVALSEMLGVFEREASFDDLAEAKCDTLPEFFASYAGDRKTVAGAFAANPDTAPCRSEYFVTYEIPPLDWIVEGETDEDILASVAQEVRSMQVVRRNVIEGNILARDGKTDDAVAKWIAAHLRNPHDTMLLERLHRLAVNAATFLRVGNVKTAVKCYETIVCVCPTDVPVLREYASCLRLMGAKELADTVSERIRELDHGHEEDADD